MSFLENISIEEKLQLFELYKTELIKISKQIADILNNHYLYGTKDEDLHRSYMLYKDSLYSLRSVYDCILEMKYIVRSFISSANRSLYCDCSQILFRYYNPLFEPHVFHLRAKFQDYCLLMLDESKYPSLHIFEPKLLIID